MPILRVNNQNFNFPSSGEEPGWAEANTGWSEAVTDVLESIAGTGTINETQVTIDNNASNKNVTGMLFNEAFTEGIEITYRIYRKTDSVELSEKGSLSLVYKPTTPEKWFMTRQIDAGDDAQVSLDITPLGQVIYTSSSVSGTNYAGLIRFKTKNILE